MAEALLKKYAGDHFEVFSAGLEPKGINPLTLVVLNEAGIETKGQYAKPLSTYLGKIDFSYLITVCSNAEDKCPIFPVMGLRLHWPFDDPASFNGSEEVKMEKFREIRNRVEARIFAWLEELGIPFSK